MKIIGIYINIRIMFAYSTNERQLNLNSFVAM